MIKNAPTLTINRLILRALALNDWEPYATAWADPELTRFIGGQPRPIGPSSTAEPAIHRLRRLGQVRARIAALGDYPEAGWALVPTAWGQGHATEAMGAVLNWADHALEVHEVRSIIDPVNLASRRVAQKLSFEASEPVGSIGIFGRPRRAGVVSDIQITHRAGQIPMMARERVRQKVTQVCVGDSSHEFFPRTPAAANRAAAFWATRATVGSFLTSMVAIAPSMSSMSWVANPSGSGVLASERRSRNQRRRCSLNSIAIVLAGWFCSPNSATAFTKGQPRKSAGAVGILFGREVGFIYRLQHQHGCCHADPIPQGRDAQGPELAVRFRDIHAPDRSRSIGLLFERKRQFAELPLDPIRFDIRKILAVHTRYALVGAAARSTLTLNTLLCSAILSVDQGLKPHKDLAMASKKCALVTNACNFAGPAAVAALSATNFQVIAHDRSFVDDRQRANFQHLHPDTMLFDEHEPEALVEAVWARVDAVDVLVSNDHHPARHVDIESASVADLQANLDMLVVRPFRLIKAIVPYFRAAKSGRIVLITSCRTKLPMAGGASPDAARDAANALVRSLAIDLAPQGIPVNAVAPNYLSSEAYYPRAAFVDAPSGRAYVAAVVPVGRLGRQEEIGEVIAFLATNDASFLTGAIIDFAGGWPVAPERPG